jgi:hypothetical protein
MTGRRFGRMLLRVVALVAGTVYFLVDAVLLTALRPLGRWLAQLPFWRHAEEWTARLPPYPTLLVFLVPVILLEPVKPLAAWLAHEGHGEWALVLFGAGEVVKVVVVERLFSRNRDKLLTIGWFARLYGLWRFIKSLVTENRYWRATARTAHFVWQKFRRAVRQSNRTAAG